jgi:ABC-type nitrate/sulfonate/bicarbonate transport system permease component
VLPPPSDVIGFTIHDFVSNLLPHFLFTLKVIVVGFCIAIPLGMAIAALFSQYRILIKAITPYIIFIVVTPMVTLMPLFMMWFGFDPNIRIMIVVLQATPIIALNAISGFSNVENSKLELMKSIGATRFQTFVKIIFPNATPQVFTGIKLGCIFSSIGAISADFVAGRYGLGYRIQQYSGLVMIEQAYGTILIVAIIGISLYEIIDTIEKKVIVWRR